MPLQIFPAPAGRGFQANGYRRLVTAASGWSACLGAASDGSFIPRPGALKIYF